MSALYDQMASDIDNIFLNANEFSEDHTVEGVAAACILEQDKLTNKDLTDKLDSILIIPVKNYSGRVKNVGDLLNIDGKEYIVQSWDDQKGVLFIGLTANATY